MWVEKLENGKYRAVDRYTDYLTGKQKKVSVTIDKNTAKSRKDAQRTLDARIAEKCKSAENHEYTLKELVGEYRKGQKGEIKESTYGRNYYICNTLMRILGENVIVGHMTSRYVKNKFKATGLDNGSLNEKLIRLKALIRWGYHNEFLSNNEIAFLDKIEPFPDVSHREKIQDKFLESEELKTLLHEMKIPAWRGITEFLALSGLRFGEMAALDLKDVDMESRLIHVTKTFDANHRIVTSPKTFTSTRDVYIQDEIIPVVKALRQVMLQQKLIYGYDMPKIFLCDPKGDYLHYDAYRKYLKENAMRSIGRKITPHVLRHTHTSLFAEQGVPLDVISRRLGHEDSKVTRDVYFHVTKRLKERDNEMVSGIKIL
jgi:integrase